MLFRKILKYFVLNVLLFMPLVAESQTEASLFLDRSITLNAEGRLGNTIEVKGHTNLPPGIQLRLVLKGFCAAPGRDYDQILDIVYLPVNAQGRFNSRVLIKQR